MPGEWSTLEAVSVLAREFRGAVGVYISLAIAFAGIAVVCLMFLPFPFSLLGLLGFVLDGCLYRTVNSFIRDIPSKFIHGIPEYFWGSQGSLIDEGVRQRLPKASQETTIPLLQDEEG